MNTPRLPLFVLKTDSEILLAEDRGQLSLIIYRSKEVADYAAKIFEIDSDEITTEHDLKRILDDARNRDAVAVSWDLLPPIPGKAPPVTEFYESIDDCERRLLDGGN